MRRMSLQTSLLLGNFPDSSRSVRLHPMVVDLRERPVGHRPVPSFLPPRAIPKPLHTRSYVPIRTGREGDPDTWPAIQIAAGSACAASRKGGQPASQPASASLWATLLWGARSRLLCAHSVRRQSRPRTRDRARTVDRYGRLEGLANHPCRIDRFSGGAAGGQSAGAGSDPSTAATAAIGMPRTS